MQKITPFLWFNGNLEKAINFYTETFKNAEITSIRRNGDTIFTATFKLEGMEFMGIDGGPMYQFTEAVSFFIKCSTQEEVDYYWDKLSEGGAISRCGWLKDQFGVSWQVIPDTLGQLLGAPDQQKAQRVIAAMMGMRKIIVADLQAAYDGNS